METLRQMRDPLETINDIETRKQNQPLSLSWRSEDYRTLELAIAQDIEQPFHVAFDNLKKMGQAMQEAHDTGHRDYYVIDYAILAMSVNFDLVFKHAVDICRKLPLELYKVVRSSPKGMWLLLNKSFDSHLNQSMAVASISSDFSKEIKK